MQRARPPAAAPPPPPPEPELLEDPPLPELDVLDGPLPLEDPLPLKGLGQGPLSVIFALPSQLNCSPLTQPDWLQEKFRETPLNVMAH